MKKIVAVLSSIGILLTSTISYASFVLSNGEKTVQNPTPVTPQQIQIEKGLASSLFSTAVTASGFRHYNGELLTKANSIDKDGLPDTTCDDIVVSFQTSTENLITVLGKLGDTKAIYLEFQFGFPSVPPANLKTMVENAHFTIDYVLGGTSNEKFVFSLFDTNGIEAVSTQDRTIYVRYLVTESTDDPFYVSLYNAYQDGSAVLIKSGEDVHLRCDFDLSLENGLTFSQFENMSLTIDIKNEPGGAL